MAGIIKRYWESTKNKLATCREAWHVAKYMEAGGCLDDGLDAVLACDPRFQTKTENDDAGSDVDGKVVVPADLDKCVKATAAFRRCMQCKPDFFREYIAVMDKGIEEDERLRQGLDVEVEDGPRFRWWTGMRYTS